jgi:hypothetical protein
MRLNVFAMIDPPMTSAAGTGDSATIAGRNYSALAPHEHRGNCLDAQGRRWLSSRFA